MKAFIALLLIAVCVCPVLITTSVLSEESVPATPPAAQPDAVRFITWNVQFGSRATPEEIGDALRLWKPDVVAFNEVPDGDWTARVGKRCGMNFAYVGSVSSANHMGRLFENGSEGAFPEATTPNFHPNKYKSILSRTPLTDTREIPVKGHGWQPATTVKATTVVKGHSVIIYSLHIAGGHSDPKGTQAEDLAKHIAPKDTKANVVVMGDFNDVLGPVMNIFEAIGFSNMWKSLKIDVSKMKTWSAIPRGGNEGVIDHLLFNHGQTTRALQGGILPLPKPLSDHKPIWADLQFGKP